MRTSWRILSLLSWLGHELAMGKFQASNIRFGGKKKDSKWKYFTKFGYNVGRGTYEFRVMLHTPTSIINDAKLGLDVYLDEGWDKVEAEESVCNRSTMARQRQDVIVNGTGAWSEWFNGTLNQRVRPHIWYFVLHDCNNALTNSTHRFKYEFHSWQEDGSEFSTEMRWMLPSNLLCLVGFTVFGCHFYVRSKVFFKSIGVHPVVWTLAAAMILQYLAQAFHTIHLYRYRINGSGVKGLEVLSEIMFMLSQVIQTSLLILIALGYTLIQSKIGELDLMIPMCFMIAVIHMMLVGFGKIQDDASYKYHENEGAVGWVLLILRLLLFVWFLWAVRSTANEKGVGRNLRNFCMGQFRVAGSIYFVTYPLIFAITKQFAPYLQHAIMSIGLMLMQMGSNLWLAALFLRKSEYWQVSTLNSSFLPGGARVGVDKEE